MRCVVSVCVLQLLILPQVALADEPYITTRIPMTLLSAE